MAMAEEMRRDPPMSSSWGEEVAEYPGAPTRSRKALLQEFGAKRVIDTPITEHGFCRRRRRRRDGRFEKPVVEFMTFNFAMQAIDQIINLRGEETLLHVGRDRWAARSCSGGPNGAASRVRRPSHSQDYSAWYSQIPRPQGDRAVFGRRFTKGS